MGEEGRKVGGNSIKSRRKVRGFEGYVAIRFGEERSGDF